MRRRAQARLRMPRSLKKWRLAMPKHKSDFTDMLDAEPIKPVLRRGRGIGLSTDVPAVEEPAVGSTQDSDSANSRIRESAPPRPKRIKRGYELRGDLISRLKRIALDEERKLYEVMEEAFEVYLAQRDKDQAAGN